MPLTSKWWTEQKSKTENKVGGKVAPETAFEKKLKLYEAARTALDKANTLPNCDAARKQLAELETARKATVTDLENKGFDKLTKALVLDTTMRKETEDIKKITESLSLAKKMEMAGNADEAVYEALWDAYEKQRDSLASAPSRKLFTSALASLNKLEAQAAKCGASDVRLTPKYNTQAKILASMKTQVTNTQTAYNTAIRNAAQARILALPPFTQLTPVLTQAVQQLTTFKTQALAAQQARNSFALTKVLKDAKAAGDAALLQYNNVSATYAPGTMLRDSTDVKTAKIHTEDSTSDIAAHSIAIMQASNANTALKRNVDTLMADIAAVKIV